MDGYDKKILYLDYLERGSKIRNAGFIKLENRAGKCRVQIQVRGLYATDTLLTELYIMSGAEEYKVDTLMLHYGTGTYTAEWNSGNMGGSGLTYKDCTGMRIRISEYRVVQNIWEIGEGQGEVSALQQEMRDPDIQQQIEPDKIILEQQARKQSIQDQTVARQPMQEQAAQNWSMQEQMAPEQMMQKQPVSEQQVPRQPVSEQQAPRQPMSDQMAQRQSMSEQEAPGQSVLNQMAQRQPMPGQMAQNQPMPNQTAQRNSMADSLIPRQTMPDQMMPTQTAPNQMMQEQTRPNQTMQWRTIPQKANEVMRAENMETRNNPDRGHKEETVEAAEKRNSYMEGMPEKQSSAQLLYDDKWMQLSQMYPAIHPFGDTRSYLSITPKDFVVLSREYQGLVNNSFLLHGYYNYGHVIVSRETEKGGEEYYLGVPGIYHDREKQVAMMFGFEGFEPGKQPLAPGGFGYYMRRVEI